MIDKKDSAGKELYQKEGHKVIWLGIDEKETGGAIQANQFLIIHKGRGVLLDPGGIHIFSRVVAAVSRHINLDAIDYILFSHQDPDVSSGIALWLSLTNARVLSSALWLRFLPHFGIVDNSRIQAIDDHGSVLKIENTEVVRFLPAHFLHSTGNFTFFDPVAGYLFSGDIGASVFDPGEEYLSVEDFSAHLAHIEGFHRRYMASKAVLKRWVDIVRRLHPQMILPQHGSFYSGENLDAFLNWLEKLDCGIDLLDKWYGGGAN